MEDFANIKFSPITKNDLILSLDRLTRFKYPEKKYYRVFNDILFRYLLAPQLSRADIEKLDIESYKYLVERVWNGSISSYIDVDSKTDNINKLIIEEENESYNLSDELKELININLNFDDVLKMIKSDSDLPLNLKRLMFAVLGKGDKKTLRARYSLKFPIEKVVLCEGITEEILLPKFASVYGYDFNKNGIHLISAGGKNQVAKLYCELKDELKLPIFVLLDADAVETSEIISTMKREQDKIYVIQRGEFEDLFPVFLIKRAINSCFKNIVECDIGDFQNEQPMTKILSEYYRINNLGDFQKADFAKEIYKNIKSDKDLTPEIAYIVEEVKEL